MDLDLQSLIELPQQVCGTVISARIRQPMPHSLSILQKHYKLQQLKVVLILKTISHAEYVVSQSEKQFFFTRDGAFWSPLPVLSVEDLLLLKPEFGPFSTKPFVGDPGIVLIKHLTELHRLSQLVYFLSYRALYPKQAIEQQQRFQGVDVSEAEQLQSYEFKPVHVERTEDPYLRFYYNLDQQKEFFELHLDPFKQLVTITFKLLPQFKSYMYIKTKIYGWAYGDHHFSPLNGLFQTDFILFNGSLQQKLPQKWIEALKEIDNEMKGEQLADDVVQEARRLKKEVLENKKNELRKKIQDYKEEQKRLEKEEKARLKKEAREAKQREKEEAAAAEREAAGENEDKPKDDE